MDHEDELNNRIQILVEDALDFVRANNHDPRTWQPLENLSKRWQYAALRLVVVGEVSRGKSTLINAVVGRKLLPDAAKALTSAWTHISHGVRLRATAHVRSGAAAPEEIAIAPADLDAYLTVDGAKRFAELHPQDDSTVVMVQIEVPAPFLAQGLEIVDTPGVGGLVAAHRHAALAAIAEADAVLFVIRPGEPITASERRFLAEAVDRVACCLIVQTHRDQLRDADRNLAADMRTLRDAGQWTAVLEDADLARSVAARFADVKAVSVSPKTSLLSMELADPALREDAQAASNMAVLLEIIESDVVARALTLHRRNVLHLAKLGVQEVERRQRQRVDMLTGDADAAAAIAEVEARIARWVDHNGDRWRVEFDSAVRAADRNITDIARRRVAELEREHLSRFPSMSAKELSAQAALLANAPESAIAEMNRSLKNDLTAAVSRIRQLLAHDGLGGPLDRLEGTKAVFGRLTRKQQNEGWRLEFDDLKAGVTGGMAGVGVAASGLLALQHGGFIAVAAAAPIAPIVLPFILGAGVFIAINQWRKRKAQSLAAAREMFAAVRKSILEDAVKAVRDAGQQTSAVLATEIEAGLLELSRQAAADRADFEAATKMSAADRLAVINAAETICEDAEQLLARAEALRGEL